MFLPRVITTVIGIPLLLYFVYRGGWLLAIGILLLAILGLDEFFGLFRPLGARPLRLLGFLVAVFLVIGAVMGVQFLEGAFALSLVASGLVYLLAYPRKSLVDLALTLYGAFFIGGLFSYAILLRTSFGNSWVYLFAVLVLVWSADTSAYLVGRAAGGRPLCPKISPQKSVEGFLGGLLGAVIAGTVLAFFLTELPLKHFIGLSVVVGIGGQLGDLFESTWKRQAGLKDSGRILPGHGGILDRFDSFLIACPLSYYYLLIVLAG